MAETPDWVGPQMLALSNKVNVKLLGVSAGIVGNFLSEHGEDFTPEELVTLSESQAQDMANDIVEHHAEQASSKLLSVTRRNIYSVFAPTVETEGIVEDEGGHGHGHQKNLAAAIKKELLPKSKGKQTARRIELESSDDDGELETEPETPLEKADMAAHSVTSGLKVVKFSVALVYATWCTDKEAFDIGHGGEIRSGPTAKASTKMLIPGLTSCKTYAELQEHFTTVSVICADHNEHGLALMVTTAWSESVSTFGPNFALLSEYWKHYLFKKYKARGLPTTFDDNLALRFKTNEATDTKKAADQATSAIKSLQTEMNEMRAKNKKLESEMTRAMQTRATSSRQEFRAKEADEKKSKEEKLKGSKCYNCGNYGHIAANCEEPDKRVKEEEDQ